MIKTKIFKEGLEDPSIDKQINKWIAKHPDYIIVDVKLGSNLYETDRATCFAYSALVIYREYENV
ncbi:sporulation protein Cse60 [Limosilactobacillus mucosae]|uniref:sporulation protein Cse60 n=1 Tax=Limosilactobacillus mucosae TaxID=97478 RepID=UPI0022E81AA0|nr:sporulation protein Cse60 [Limosilactobacillus mucosae]